jgi:SAM-dependent methyltransferase
VTTAHTKPDPTDADTALKGRHRAMWALGDYHAVATEVIPDLGPVLVEATRLGPGDHVLDVAAGSGNVAIPAAATGAHVIATDLTPELLDQGRVDADAAGVNLAWEVADAEHLPYGDDTFDAVTSCVGVMFAPHHQAAADELVRVCRPGGTIGLLSWTPEGVIGGLFRTIGPFAPPPPPGAQPPPLWGSEAHLEELLGERVQMRTLARDDLEVTAFAHPREFAEHFRARYGPALAARVNAEKNGRADELDAALDRFCDDWNRGSEDQARFEMEYLLAVGTRL